MNTRKLFQENVYLSKCESEIIDIKDDAIALKETVFFPEGGGQSSDRGTIDNMFFDYSYEENDLIWHCISDHNFQIGQKVKLEMDWAHRFDNMQRHCGEHIMSGMWHREYGGVNKGFHMGDEYMTVDISLEDNAEYKDKPMTMDMALHVEQCTNEAIWANLPVITRRFKTREEAEHLPLRKPLALDEEISVVSVGSVDNPSDCVACCGTHPSTSGQVGLLKIYKLEKNKNMWRIYFEAGKRAMEDYDKKHNLLTQLGIKYSAGLNDLYSKLEAGEKAHDNLKEKLNNLYIYIVELRKSRLKESLNHCTSSFYVYEENLLDADNILRVIKDFAGDSPLPGAIVKPDENLIFLFSDGKNFKCGDICKTKGKELNGRGGGSPTSARISFSDKKSFNSFLEFLKNI